MNATFQSNNERLRTVVREARPSPPLPPRFQESVWRRIESAKTPGPSFSLAGWFDQAAGWLLRPRLAMAGVAAMLLIGISIGVVQGGSLAHDLARQRYIAAVSPLTSP
jgi:hypothetical protein